MQQTQRFTNRLRRAKTAFRLLSTCSIATLILSCCTQQRPFPAQYVHEYDSVNKVCGLYKIVDPANLKFEYVQDEPCPDIFGFSAGDMPAVLDWGKYMQDYTKAHCQ